MKNNKYLPVILFFIGAAIGIAGMLVVCLDVPLGYKILGLVAVGICVGLWVYGYILSVKQQKAQNSQQVRHVKAKPRAKNRVPHTGKVLVIRQDDKLNLDIWGEVREIEISSQRILYGDGGKEFFNEEELAALNAIINSGVINSEDVKAAVLKYVNEVTEMWDDDYYDGKIKSILPPEVEINQLIINNLRADDVTVGFCGEALCDEEHGIAICFKDGKLVGVTSVGDFL